jgi:hypothetical protein
MRILADFEKAALLGLGEAPIVDDQQRHAGERFEPAAIATVAAGDGKRLEEARNTLVQNTFSVATGLVGPVIKSPPAPIHPSPTAQEAANAAWRMQIDSSTTAFCKPPMRHAG